MGRASKQKGYRVERALVERLHTVHPRIKARRVPFSGSARHLGPNLANDVEIILDDEVIFRGESKGRKRDNGFKQIKDWLDDADILFIKEDNKDFIVVMPWVTLSKLINLLMDA